MPPGWQPTVDDGHRVVAETWAGAPGVAPRGSPGVLVGRTRELATITTAMTAARRAWCPGREVGIGKTALAEHTAVMASGHEWAVVCNTLRGGLTRGK
jgi:hypothetical protein